MSRKKEKNNIFALVIPKNVGKQIEDIDQKYRSVIVEKLKQLVADADGLDIKRLVGFSSLYRLRAGNYRIVYEIYEQQMIIRLVAVGPRKNIYQQLKKMF